jgi:glutaredoxin 3
MATKQQVTIYSTPTCHFCHMAKEFFKENDVAYTDYNVATDLDKRKEMVTKSGQMGVPVIDVGGKIIVGFDEEGLRQVLAV